MRKPSKAQDTPERSAVGRKKAISQEISPVPFHMDKPLVFVSHDSRDADLAEAFGTLLTDASGGMLKSFRSFDRKGTAGSNMAGNGIKLSWRGLLRPPMLSPS
jgi:hypothetical protein